MKEIIMYIHFEFIYDIQGLAVKESFCVVKSVCLRALMNTSKSLERTLPMTKHSDPACFYREVPSITSLAELSASIQINALF